MIPVNNKVFYLKIKVYQIKKVIYIITICYSRNNSNKLQGKENTRIKK